jgi:hypothetical protein
MKYVWRIAFIGVFLAPIAKAEVTTIKKKSATAKLAAFENLETKLAALEDYSVEYVNADKSHEVLKSAPARQIHKNQMTVELRAKKKS